MVPRVLAIIILQKKGQQLKYIDKYSTHTPGMLRAMLSGVLQQLAKLTSRTPEAASEQVDAVYLNHVNALCKEGLTPSIFPILGCCIPGHRLVQYERIMMW